VIYKYKYTGGRTNQTVSNGEKDALETDFPSFPRETIPSDVTTDCLAILDMTTRCACFELKACGANETAGIFALEEYSPCIRGTSD
jgi:hypothetical protein